MPTAAYQFGGFVAGTSKSGNASAYDLTYNYIQDSATNSGVTGWRVFDIDGDKITLLSAGNPEDYYNDYGEANEAEYMLTGNINSELTDASSYTKRDWSAYVNTDQAAVSATAYSKSLQDSWFTKYIKSSDFQTIYESGYEKYMNIIDNNSYYYYPSPYNYAYLYNFNPAGRSITAMQGTAMGIRVVVNLSEEALLSATKKGTKTLTGGRISGSQTYNVWGLKGGGSVDPDPNPPAPVDEWVKASKIYDYGNTSEEKMHIGDFVNYDAGTWTSTEINSIQTGAKSDLQTANGSTSLPSNSLQFGGFVAGASRNGNATSYDSAINYVKDTSTGNGVTGWRVFDIDGDKVTLISAGNTEDFLLSGYTNMGYIGEYVLTGKANSNWSAASTAASTYKARCWNIYTNTNQKAESATVLTKNILDTWYGKYMGVSSPDVYTTSTFQLIYDTPYVKYQNLIDNYSNYWLANASSTTSEHYLMYRVVNSTSVDKAQVFKNVGNAYGIRPLVTLSTEALFSSTRAGTKTLTGGNMDKYGGNQTYNVWNLKSYGSVTPLPDPDPDPEPEPEPKPEPTWVSASTIYDSTGNQTDSLHIGDFVNYDAGTWTQSEISAIQTGSTSDGLQTPNGSTSLPSTAFQFGGFTVGSSRNGNATPYSSSNNYIKDVSTGSAVTGWRVFDIVGDQVTLISAGNPEDYYHGTLSYAYLSEEVLAGSSSATYYKIRNWSDYVNPTLKATSAIALSKSKLESWYKKYLGTDSSSTDLYVDDVFQKIYSNARYMNIIDNNSYYWLAGYNDTSKGMPRFNPSSLSVGHYGDYAFGVRVLVTLSSSVLFYGEKAGTKTLTGGNMSNYGGNQTYNVWNIK